MGDILVVLPENYLSYKFIGVYGKWTTKVHVQNNVNVDIFAIYIFSHNSHFLNIWKICTPGKLLL